MGPFEIQVESSFSDAIHMVRSEISQDTDLHRSYHDNVAMSIYDNSSLSVKAANVAADSVMDRLFSETEQLTPWGPGLVQSYLLEAVAEKVATKAVPTGRMSGQLKFSSSGWALLDVPNFFVRSIFSSMDEPGISLPVSGEFGNGKLNAHISVMNPEEVKAAGGKDNVRSHDGRSFRYQLGPMKVVTPMKSKEWRRVWYITVRSPELEEFRKSFGLSARPNKNQFDFHITVAVLLK